MTGALAGFEQGTRNRSFFDLAEALEAAWELGTVVAI
jgi:hypothetical protein